MLYLHLQLLLYHLQLILDSSKYDLLHQLVQSGTNELPHHEDSVPHPETNKAHGAHKRSSCIRFHVHIPSRPIPSLGMDKECASVYIAIDPNIILAFVLFFRWFNVQLSKAIK